MPNGCKRTDVSCTDCGTGSPDSSVIDPPSLKYWIGLDVGLDLTNICVIDESGAVWLEGAVRTHADVISDAISDFAPNGAAVIGLESGTGSRHLTRRLRALSYSVVVFDARKVKKFLEIRRHKTDVNDARGLAEVARYGMRVVTEVHLRSEETQRLRSQLRLRRGVVEQRKTTESFLRSLIHLNGGRLRASSSARALERNVRAELSRLRDEDGIDIMKEAEPLLEISLAMRRYAERVDKELAALAEANPVCRRFMAISGVGSVCALTFFSTVEDPARFPRVSDVASYVGLVPRIHQSGKKWRRAAITKMGDTLARVSLVQSATVLLHISKEDSDLRRWGLSLAERIGPHRARVAVARKLSVVMISLWKNDVDYQPFPQGAGRDSIISDFQPEAIGLDSEKGTSGTLTQTVIV